MVTEMFKQTCRTCLSTDGEMVSIFSSGFYVNQLPKKLMAFTKVEISDKDDLPKVICKKCMFLADSFYCFKVQCESADNQLKSLIQKSLNKDSNSLNDQKKINPDSKACKLDLELVTTFKDVKNPKTEANHLSEDLQETEDNYVIDYVSEEVRIDVENAIKRRQEAERKISMEKVSKTISNLKGIEVVPIGDLANARNERNSNRIKQEEIVMFPVKVPKKRCKVIETIVIDSPPPLNKRLKLPPDTTVSKVNGGCAKREDYVVYGKDKKLHFSTVRKVVKIDEELCVEPKIENGKEYNKENCRVKYDTDVLGLRNDSEKQKPLFQFSKIQIDEKEELDSEKQEPNVLDNKFGKESKDSGTAHDQKVSDYNKKQNECTYYPSTIDKPVKVLASLESNELQRHKVANNTQNYDLITKSTIGSIISEIEDQNFDDIDHRDDGEDGSTFENSNDSSKSYMDCRMDKSNEVFIENEVGNLNDNFTSSCFGSEKIEQEKVKENLISKSSVAGNQEENSDQVKVEDSTINFKIYKRNDVEKMGRVEEEESSAQNQAPDFSSSHQNPGNPNLKFYQCAICLMNFVSRPVVLKHNIQEHMADQAPFSCIICDKSFEDKPSLCEHVEEHDGLKPYKCTFCPKTFTLKRNLKRHVDHHINYKPFQCRICMKRFTEKSSLKSHMYLHTGDSPFACKICNVSFNNKTNWRRHVITIHEKLNVVVCQFCNKELPDKRSLQVHSRVHTGDRPYQCPHCEKRFTQQCNLNTHIHCHLNDRPFGCPHCGKGFNQRGTRDDHILTHTGEKPHKCTECDASFTVASALKRHMWIHTDKDRPYNCVKCKLQFVGLYDLRRHLKTRHGEVVKLENPRVERVLIDNRNKQPEGSNTLGQSELDLTENEATDSREIECNETEITAKTNSSLSCSVNKVEDLQMEEVKESFSETMKFENLNNGAKKEIVDDSEVLIESHGGTRISCTDNTERCSEG